jgi:hypothetical protein
MIYGFLGSFLLEVVRRDDKLFYEYEESAFDDILWD